MATMTRDEAIQEIKRMIPATRHLEKSKDRNKYNCIFCSSGHGQNGHHTGAMHYFKDTNTVFCFSCHNVEIGEKPADPIDVHMKYYGVDFLTAVNQLAEELNITISENRAERPQSEKQSKSDKKTDTTTKPAENGAGAATEPVKQPTPGQYADYIEKCTAGAGDTDYLTARGITPETVKKFMLGYDAEKKAIVIPYGKNCSYYIARSIEGKRFYKPKRDEAGEEPVYNAAALYNEDQPCFICESPLDAISIMQAGGNAAAIGGTGSDKLIKKLQEKKPEKPLILCFDNDEAGRNASARMIEALETMAQNEAKPVKIPYIEAFFNLDQYGDGAKKDANDLLRGNAGQLAKDVKRNIKAALRKEPFIPYRVSDYITGGNYDADIDYFKQYKDRKPGFDNLNNYLTLYPGLAALGGSASLGKTTFAVNLADNLLESGETILYFALEQEPIEIITKSLARRLAEKDPNSPINNIQIKNGASSAALEAVKREYAQIADRFIIVRCNFTTTAAAIRDYVETFIKRTGKKPIVFIDYLQLISPPADLRTDNIRTATDYNVKLFKTMQVDNELLVIMISNFNRGSYSTPVSYEAFKETGMIEYTCDYVWGLQLAALEDDSFYTRTGKNGGQYDTSIKAKSDKLYTATSNTTKDVEFVSLKSRNGRQSYKAFFKYDMPFDTFIPDHNSQYDKTGGDGFTKMPGGYKTPFDDGRL